jgi:D-3-phosphoglycerate dehydrogenase
LKKIILIDTFHSSFKKNLEQNNFECVEAYNWSREKIISELKNATGIAIRSRFKLDKDFLQHAVGIKFIARGGAGMENIDVSFAESIGIKCLNSPEANRDAVGEHALAMLLSLFNQIIKANSEVRKGIWLREENRGVELQGKTVGIIGFGNMGSAFAKKLQGFDAEILAYDKYISIDTKKFPFVKQVSLEEIFERADIVSLHVPLTPETNYLIGDAFISSFKKNIYVINTSRGKCLNTSDLVFHLKSGKVLGACLDVLEYESISFENIDATKLPEPFQYLAASDKVILSPHIAGWTHESNEKIATVLVKKILELFK